MNILFLALDVNLAAPQGDAIHVRELVRFLGTRGNQVDLVTVTSNSVVPGLGENVRHHTLASSSDWSAVRQCARIARRARSEVVYERRLSPKISFAVSRLVGIPFVVEVNGIEEEARMLGSRKVSPWRPVKVRLRRRAYRRAAHVVAVTNRLAAIVRDENRLAPERVTTIHNGVDPQKFAPKNVAEAQRTLGLPAGTWIVFVGNLVPWQGIDVLLRGVQNILRRHAAVRLAVVGNGMLRGSLERLAHEIGVAESTLFVGDVSHEVVSAYIGAAAICVAPFTRIRNEGIGVSPLKVYEYLSCGRPVVASDVPGIAELLIQSRAGLVVPPDDPQALAASLSSLLASPEERNRMGQRGRDFAVSKCTWAQTAERVEAVIRDALAAGRTRVAE